MTYSHTALSVQGVWKRGALEHLRICTVGIKARRLHMLGRPAILVPEMYYYERLLALEHVHPAPSSAIYQKTWYLNCSRNSSRQRGLMLPPGNEGSGVRKGGYAICKGTFGLNWSV